MAKKSMMTRVDAVEPASTKVGKEETKIKEKVVPEGPKVVDEVVIKNPAVNVKICRNQGAVNTMIEVTVEADVMDGTEIVKMMIGDTPLEATLQAIVLSLVIARAVVLR